MMSVVGAAGVFHAAVEVGVQPAVLIGERCWAWCFPSDGMGSRCVAEPVYFNTPLPVASPAQRQKFALFSTRPLLPRQLAKVWLRKSMVVVAGSTPGITGRAGHHPRWLRWRSATW